VSTSTGSVAALYSYAFGDETGEAGFRFERGSSTFFVAGLVLTNRPNKLRQCVSDFQQELRLKARDELSFRRSPDRNRSLFLGGLLECDLQVRALVVNKVALSTELKRLNRADFYVWAFSDLLAHTLNELDEATVLLDEFGRTNETIRALKRALRNTFSSETVRQHIRRISSRRSQSEPILQVADMVTGAIYRHVANRDSRFYRIIESRSVILQV
jgi:hypothetical protein